MDPAEQAAFGQRISDAARELANVTIAAFKEGAGVHPATVVAGCARMAGTRMFRSFKLTLPAGVKPGDPVLSMDADLQGAMLMRVTANILSSLKVPLPNVPPPDDGRALFKPLHDFLATQRQLEPCFAPVLERFGFTPVQEAQACAVAAALLIHTFRSHLDPAIGFKVATVAIVEGCKTAPDPIVSAAA